MPKIELKCMGCLKTLSLRWPDRQPALFPEIVQFGYDEGWRMSRGEWFCGSRCVKKEAERNADKLEGRLRRLAKQEGQT